MALKPSGFGAILFFERREMTDASRRAFLKVSAAALPSEGKGPFLFFRGGEARWRFAS